MSTATNMLLRSRRFSLAVPPSRLAEYRKPCSQQNWQIPRHNRESLSYRQHLLANPLYNCIIDKPKSDSEVHKKTEPPPSKPDPEYESLLYLDGIGTFDVISLPPRHLLWTCVLALLNRNFPGVWDAQEFTDGVEAAVKTVYSLLASGDDASVEGLVEKELLESFRTVDAVTAREKERWDAPPSMSHCKLLGILYAEGIDSEKGRRFRVTPLLCSDEEYTYTVQANLSRTVRRIHSWTFERKLDEGDHWSVVGMSSKHWYWSEDQ